LDAKTAWAVVVHLDHTSCKTRFHFSLERAENTLATRQRQFLAGIFAGIFAGICVHDEQWPDI